MASKRIFSLRLNEDIRSDLLKTAEAQSTTITALINKYILEGLSKDGAFALNTVTSNLVPRVTQPETITVSAAEERIEELLFQVLLNQRQIISTTDKNQSCLTEIHNEMNKKTKI